MIVHAANPIYDSIFKYLVEDKRIAKILISALLKKEVLNVEFRRHEYTNNVRNDISMFRIDFGARVREADGSEHLVLIELQKTWIETETLRFRQYLGAQYSDPNNIQKEERLKHGYAIPMVTVYLLGHKVGNIEEPILYVNHKSYDYNGHEITQGLPDPFVESLVHNSINRLSFWFISLSFGRMPKTISSRCFSVILLLERHTCLTSLTISTLLMTSSR